MALEVERSGEEEEDCRRWRRRSLDDDVR